MAGRREKMRHLADVSIWQFADAPEPIDRAAKHISDQRSLICRLVASAATAGSDHLAEPVEDDADAETDADSDVDTVANNPTIVNVAATFCPPVTYPATLWQLVGGYVHPESVGAFAALCRDARRATRARTFWRRLFLRWAWTPAAASDDAAPHELRRRAILACNDAVRPRVIRALHRWHFADRPPATAPPPPPPTGLRFLRFEVRASSRRLLVLFARGRRSPAPPRPPPDSWEEAAAASAEAADTADQRCPTEGQWLLTADLADSGTPTCLDDLLALDAGYLLAGFTCLTVGGCANKAVNGVGATARRRCELLLRAPHGESRAVAFACVGQPRLLPWWRPGFLPALRGCD